MLLTIRRISLALALLMIVFSRPASAAALEEILVAHPALTFGDIPYFIARENGFYRDEGFQVKDIMIRGGVTASQALQAGSVQFTLALGTGARGNRSEEHTPELQSRLQPV